jgi:hypothetical protein
VLACVLTLGRFCAQPSELSLAERWYDDTALEDLLGVPLAKINDARLDRGLDALLPHKDALCQHLLAKYRDWFGVRFEFLLSDVTSTFFEGQALKNAKGWGDCARQLLLELDELHSLDMVLPVRGSEGTHRKCACGWWRDPSRRGRCCWHDWAWKCRARPKSWQM